MRLLGYAVGLSCLAGCFFIGGRLESMFDFTAFFGVLFGGLGFTIAAHGTTTWRALSAGFSSDALGSEERAHLGCVLHTLNGAFFNVGIAYGLIGAIHMSWGVPQTEDFKVYGPAFGVVLLGPLYGVVFGRLVVAPLMDRLASHGSNG